MNKPFVTHYRFLLAIALTTACLVTIATADEDEKPFRVGFAQCDVTPQAPMPMWGYGARHDALSQGILDPLYARAIVIEAGDDRLAIVGTDLGRGPTPAMMDKIRQQVGEQAGIGHVLICGSHSHHGPVIELTDREGFGRGKYDAAVAYAKKLPDDLIAVILEAAGNLQDATMGIASKDLDYNRNRHTKRQPKPTDPELAVIRFDNTDGETIAVLANFAAHPVMTDEAVLKFSADYPGFMCAKVQAELGAPCVFIQGAAGDMSPNPGEDRHGPEKFGKALADHVIELARQIEPARPARPMIQGKVDRFTFDSRLDFNNPFLSIAFGRAFFPELVRNFLEEWRNGVQAELNTVVLNREVALVGGSGEFFCNHSNRLKQRSYLDHTLFFGYCNAHNLYYPTIEAASEGGYGADPTVSPVELGAGERMMNQALINIYGFLGRFDPNPAMQATP